MSYMAACPAGVDVLDTALSSGMGDLPASYRDRCCSSSGTPYDTGLDLGAFEEAVRYFKDLKEKYRGILDPISEQIDTNVLIY